MKRTALEADRGAPAPLMILSSKGRGWSPAAR